MDPWADMRGSLGQGTNRSVSNAYSYAYPTVN